MLLRWASRPPSLPPRGGVEASGQSYCGRVRGWVSQASADAPAGATRSDAGRAQPTQAASVVDRHANQGSRDFGSLPWSPAAHVSFCDFSRGSRTALQRLAYFTGSLSSLPLSPVPPEIVSARSLPRTRPPCPSPPGWAWGWRSFFILFYSYLLISSSNI